MNVVRLKFPTPDEVQSLRPLAEDFCSFYARNFITTACHYMHILRAHVPDMMQQVYQTWGVGLGMFSTQASEHGNKMAKAALKYLSGFTGHQTNKFDMFMRHRLLQLLVFTDTIPTVGVHDKCKACGEVGHRKNNTLCKMYGKVVVPAAAAAVDGVEEAKQA